MSVFTLLLALALASPFRFQHALAQPDGLDVHPVSDLAHRSPLRADKQVIVQMFGWNWDSISQECVDFLGPSGYGFVQVSPPQEHIVGPQWWTDYQPVSYTLTSKRGNREQFRSMIDACHSVGVGVIVDTIWNHMSGMESGIGVGNTSFTHYEYPGTYQYENFHHCGLTPDDDIVDYKNRDQVQTCELLHLSDLATETEYVRSRLAAYTNDLLSLGADGLRLDAAKHIATGDIANILTRLSRKPYITQEVIFGEGEPITPAEYIGNGDVQEFRYTTTLRDAFLNGSISSLRNFDNRGWIPGAGANVFVANHDTERYGSSLNIHSPSNSYILATIFSLAHPYGTPTILSSFSFADGDDGAPSGGAGTCSATGGRNGWLCQHRNTAISGMVEFRNAVGAARLTNWFSPNGQPERIAFGRGSAGFIAINNRDQAWSATFRTSLPAGTYCDRVTGKRTSTGTCTGKSVRVARDGTFVASVSPRSAIAIHVRGLKVSV